MSSPNVKDEVRRLLDRLPDDSTWDDVMHEIYVRQSIETGLADTADGKTVEVAEVRKRFWVARVKVLWTESALAQLLSIHHYLSQTPLTTLAALSTDSPNDLVELRASRLPVAVYARTS